MPRDSSPTPSEREKLDAEARQKEQEEQSKLPYKWTQTISDVDITVPLPVEIKAKQLDVKIAKKHLYVSVKNEPSIIDVRSASHYLNPSACAKGYERMLTSISRATFPTQSMLTSPRGPLKRILKAKNSPSISTRSTKWSGGRTW